VAKKGIGVRRRVWEQYRALGWQRAPRWARWLRAALEESKKIESWSVAWRERFFHSHLTLIVFEIAPPTLFHKLYHEAVS